MTNSSTGQVAAQPEGMQSIVADWSSDQRAFKNVSWGKAMMWIFLLSDTFIFSCFLISYMTVRMSTTIPWPNSSEIFALSFGGEPIPLILIAIMTFICFYFFISQLLFCHQIGANNGAEIFSFCWT